ncbi:MAG: rhomboid family intramembrane serine protease [Gammaproteobacteria bacterium]|nr:MAG: rhomboid family intramembrane serine protease [Gammaproteobacteria bacterium]
MFDIKYLQTFRRAPVTLFLLITSIVISIPTVFRETFGVVTPFVSGADIQYLFGITTPFSRSLSEVADGEIYRLFTPMFIHFGLIHIVFNMLCLKDLGRLIEYRLNSNILVAIVLITGVCSNLAQFVFVSAGFGGMSGVIFGFIGYLWVQQKYNPNFGVFIPKESFTLVMVWFFACIIGIIPYVANHAHAAGLISGGILGLIDARYDILSRLFNINLLNRLKN